MGTQLKQAMIAAGAHKIKVRRTKRIVQRTQQQRTQQQRTPQQRTQQQRATIDALWVKDTQPGPLTRK